MTAGSERGSQALEFALALPAVALVLLVVCTVGGIATDVVRAQHVARDAARAAVLESAFSPPSDATVTVSRRDATVRVTVRLHSRWASPFVDGPDVVGRAVMPLEPQTASGDR